MVSNFSSAVDATVLFVSLGYFEQMVAELGFDRSLYDANVTAKDSLIEFGNHLPRGKRS